MKKTLLGVGVILLVIILFFAFRAKRIEAPASENPTSASHETLNPASATTTKPSVAPVTKPATNPLVTNLFPQKGSFECRYEQAIPTGKSTNTVYISNGKMRSEFRTTDSQGFSTLSMLVYDGTYLYRWTEGKGTGVKNIPKSLNDIPVALPTDVHEGKVLGSGYNNVSWDCHAWPAVSNMLNKPAYVTFN